MNTRTTLFFSALVTACTAGTDQRAAGDSVQALGIGEYEVERTAGNQIVHLIAIGGDEVGRMTFEAKGDERSETLALYQDGTTLSFVSQGAGAFAWFDGTRVVDPRTLTQGDAQPTLGVMERIKKDPGLPDDLRTFMPRSNQVAYAACAFAPEASGCIDWASDWGCHEYWYCFDCGGGGYCTNGYDVTMAW